MKLIIRKIISETRSIFSGENRDYTSGSLKKAVLYLSVPIVFEMALESVFSVVDAFFVGKLGSDVLAAVGITDSVITIVFAVGIGVSMGATAMVARRYGEKEYKAAAIAAAQVIWLTLFISIPITIIGISYPKEIL